MNKFLRLSPLFFASAIVLFSCAKEVSETADNVEKRVLEAYVKVNYNNSIQPTTSGLYIINKKIGTGAAVKASCGLFVRYSTLDLQRNYLSTTYDSVAKVVGGFSDTTYYGPQLIEMGNYTTIRGFEDALLTLKAGSKARVIIPSWLSDYKYTGSSRSFAATKIYDVEILRVVDSIPKFEIDTLEAFRTKYYKGVDSLAKGFYFKTLKAGIGDTLKTGETISYWYVGRLLDGFVFDTNIEDTARKYKIYNPSRTGGYVAKSVTIQEPGNSEETVIKGMDKTFLNMKHGGKAISFFSSDWGYGSTQMPFGIYQPLIFYVEVVTDNNEDL